MPQLSLTKILIAIIAIIALLHLRDILNVLSQIYEWFANSLGFMKYFPQGAQVAIAFYSILLVIVLVFKTIKK